MVEFGCSDAICKVFPAKKGKTGLTLQWISFNSEKQSLNWKLGFIKRYAMSLHVLVSSNFNRWRSPSTREEAIN